MADGQKYSFKIGAYSPKTLPLGRLIKYLAQIEKLYAGSDKVHLVGALKTESTSLPLFVDDSFESQFVEIPYLAADEQGTAGQNAAYRELSHMAHEDGQPLSILSPSNDNLYDFPMRPRLIEEPVQPRYEGVRDRMTIIGKIYKVGSSAPNSKTNQVWIEEKFTKKKITNAWATNDQVRNLGDEFKQFLILDGIATLNRSQNGEWELVKFEVQTFSKNEDAPKSMAFDDIKRTSRTWPSDIRDRLYDPNWGEE